MTQTELEQLSRDVAKKRGCEPYKGVFTARDDDDFIPIFTSQWLHQDSAFCFELMVSERMDVKVYKCHVEASYSSVFVTDATEEYADHNNDATQATRVAILKAYLAKGE